MRMIWNKGHRIRASDKHLVYHFSIETLLFVFVAVLLLLNSKQLMRTDWEHFSLLDNGFTLSLYNFITILIATGWIAPKHKAKSLPPTRFPQRSKPLASRGVNSVCCKSSTCTHSFFSYDKWNLSFICYHGYCIDSWWSAAPTT